MIRATRIINAAMAGVLFFVLFVICGCATGRTDLVKNGTVSFERQARGKVYIASSGAYEEEGGLVISGVLRRRWHTGLPTKAHVDITIMAADGTVLAEGRSSDIYVARRVTGRGHQSFERFKVRFANIPAEGSLIRVVSHSGGHV